MFEIMRNNVLFDITAVPRTQQNRMRLKSTFVTLKILFQVSISEDVRLS